MKKGCSPLIYECFDNSEYRDYILNKTEDIEIKKHIENLYTLINYQISIIHEQRLEIVASKHKKSWQQYDKQ